MPQVPGDGQPYVVGKRILHKKYGLVIILSPDLQPISGKALCVTRSRDE